MDNYLIDNHINLVGWRNKCRSERKKKWIRTEWDPFFGSASHAKWHHPIGWTHLGVNRNKVTHCNAWKPVTPKTLTHTVTHSRRRFHVIVQYLRTSVPLHCKLHMVHNSGVWFAIFWERGLRERDCVARWCHSNGGNGYGCVDWRWIRWILCLGVGDPTPMQGYVRTCTNKMTL